MAMEEHAKCTDVTAEYWQFNIKFNITV